MTLQEQLLTNFSDIIHFANVFGKTTTIPVVNIHNETNENIYIQMRNQNTHNDFLYIICDKQNVIGYNLKLNKYKCSSVFPIDFHKQIEEASLMFTNEVIKSFYHDIKRFKLGNPYDYSEKEREVASKFYKDRFNFSISQNNFNKWKKDSIPLIEFKNTNIKNEEIIDVQCC